MSAFTCFLVSSMSHMKDLHVAFGEFRRLFHDMGKFVYYSNFSNLEDMLIAEGSHLFFAREDLSCRADEPEGGCAALSCFCKFAMRGSA